MRTHTKRPQLGATRIDPNAVQHVWKFDNGRTLSVVRNNFATHGGRFGRWEAWDFDPDRGPTGYLTPADVRRMVREIEAKP